MSHPPVPGVELVYGQVRSWGLDPAGAWGRVPGASDRPEPGSSRPTASVGAS